MSAIIFKKPSLALAWLETALKKEKEKYQKCPVVQDIVHDCMAAQGWGYVIAGYFLVEEALKVILHVRGNNVYPRHPLHALFEDLTEYDKSVLREFFDDYKGSAERGLGSFPFESIDDFLENLDGDDSRGSFDWRYFLMEEIQSEKMPLVSVDYLHEIAYGCIVSIEYLIYEKGNPLENIHSCRLWWEREKKYLDELESLMNSPKWEKTKSEDRIEIWWGPDYRDRYDLIIYQKGKIRIGFCKIPDDLDLPIIDKIGGSDL